jgi:hypothetical protein
MFWASSSWATDPAKMTDSPVNSGVPLKRISFMVSSNNTGTSKLGMGSRGDCSLTSSCVESLEVVAPDFGCEEVDSKFSRKDEYCPGEIVTLFGLGVVVASFLGLSLLVVFLGEPVGLALLVDFLDIVECGEKAVVVGN